MVGVQTLLQVLISEPFVQDARYWGKSSLHAGARKDIPQTVKLLAVFTQDTACEPSGGIHGQVLGHQIEILVEGGLGLGVKGERACAFKMVEVPKFNVSECFELLLNGLGRNIDLGGWDGRFGTIGLVIPNGAFPQFVE